VRIAIISREFPRATAWGGMANFYSQFAEALRSFDVEVEVFAQGLTGSYTEVVNGVTVHRVRPEYKGRPITSMNGEPLGFDVFVRMLSEALCRSFLQRHQERPFSVVEGHDHLGLTAFLPSSLNVPVFLTGHTTLSVFNRLPGFMLDFRGSLEAVSALEYEAHLRADKIRFLSRDLLERTCALFPGIRDKSEVVYNPTRVPNRAEIHFRPLQNEQLEFLFVGRLETRKGVHLFAEAMPKVWNKFPNARLTLVGQNCTYEQAGTSMQEYLTEAWESFDPKNWRFMGQRPKPYVETLYLKTSFVVVPSLYDNSAFSAQEGMAHGRCILCSKAGGTPEYL
jgi:glycosyltransferase involved in cell wall biosynthesis